MENRPEVCDIQYTVYGVYGMYDSLTVHLMFSELYSIVSIISIINIRRIRVSSNSIVVPLVQHRKPGLQNTEGATA